MSQFQRMVAIPQEEYLQMTAVQNVRQPLTQQFYNLESQYNQEATIQDPYKRLVLQSQTLDDMKQLKEQMRHYLTLSTPKPYRTRAQALLESISPFLQYNERGEIYDKEHNLIANSRLEDLIQYAVRDRRRRHVNPTGWDNFLSLLLENNIPRSILNRNTISEMEELNKPPSTNIIPPAPNVKQEPSSSRKRKIEEDSPILPGKSARKKIAPILPRKSTRKKTPSQKLLDPFLNYK